MAKKKYHFISGLPRSGSTLLVSILNQNPRFFAEIQNPLYEMINNAFNVAHHDNTAKITVPPERMKNAFNGLIDGYYSKIDKEIIFNVSRGWTGGVEYLNALNSDFKIICMVREYISILNSFEHLFKTRGFNYTPIYKNNIANVYIRTNQLGQDGFVKNAYNSLREAYFGPFRKNLLIVEYNELVDDPVDTMERIYDFIGEDTYEHNFDEVGCSFKEYDYQLGLDLHTIRPQIKNRHLPTILPPDLVENYKNWEFWR